ncbi:ArsR family transcriptional regulator [Halobacteriales archaeon QS_5_68_33]|nr:MAG: ArsR family transcriptional regulator [Halobacteriales archaeon QS_5_68_33]
MRAIFRDSVKAPAGSGRGGSLRSSLRCGAVAGRYDIIVEAVGEEVYDLMHGVATQLRDIDGIADTKTYICLD